MIWEKEKQTNGNCSYLTEKKGQQAHKWSSESQE